MMEVSTYHGFTHQDPGFIDHVVNKKASIVRVYLPPDANCLLSVWDHCLMSRDYVNVVIAGKYQAPQWITMDTAIEHCTTGIGFWKWASSDQGADPDVVMACCGDVPILQTLAAVSIFRKHLPDLKIRVISVIDLMKLEPITEHPHGLSDKDFDMTVLNDLDRFHLVQDVINRLPKLVAIGATLKQLIQDKLVEHTQYIDRYGLDMPEIRNWKLNIPK